MYLTFSDNPHNLWGGPIMLTVFLCNSFEIESFIHSCVTDYWFLFVNFCRCNWCRNGDGIFSKEESYLYRAWRKNKICGPYWISFGIICHHQLFPLAFISFPNYHHKCNIRKYIVQTFHTVDVLVYISMNCSYLHNILYMHNIILHFIHSGETVEINRIM